MKALGVCEVVSIKANNRFSNTHVVSSVREIKEGMKRQGGILDAYLGLEDIVQRRAIVLTGKNFDERF